MFEYPSFKKPREVAKRALLAASLAFAPAQAIAENSLGGGDSLEGDGENRIELVVEHKKALAQEIEGIFRVIHDLNGIGILDGVNSIEAGVRIDEVAHSDVSIEELEDVRNRAQHALDKLIDINDRLSV